MARTAVYFRTADTPAEIVALLRALAPEYPVREGRARGRGLQARFEPLSEPGAFRVSAGPRDVLIQYAAPALAARALGSLWGGAARGKRPYEERTPLRTLGFMLDCSRYSVVTPAHFTRWLRRAALLGYNQAMLYTEDVYTLPGEPFFGYLRGAYTEAELRDMDACAADLGIELVACIQTLGHLNHALKWPAYAGIRQSPHALRVGAPETYALIDKMLAHWARVFRSRRIHLGMDEATDFVRGRAEPPDRLFFDHLAKVAALCEKYGLRPMIWSDMVFWVNTPERPLSVAYRNDPPVSDPAALNARLPPALDLVCWHYSPRTPEVYLHCLAKHRALGREPIMASGCHAWGRFWHDQESMTAPRVAACLKACRAFGVRDLLMTLWTGAEGVDLDSAWAGLAYSAELAFIETPSARRLERRYHAVFGAEYEASVSGALDIWWAGPHGVGAAALFKDDPLQSLLLRALEPAVLRRIERQYRRQAARLARWRGQTVAGDMDYVRHLAEFLGRKAGFFLRARSAYRCGAKPALRAARRELPALRRSLDAVRRTFRRMWLRQYKPSGMEIVQTRMAGQAARFEELALRLDEVLAGTVERIPEWDAPAVFHDLDAIQKKL